jgi:cysteine dioxygenase
MKKAPLDRFLRFLDGLGPENLKDGTVDAYFAAHRLNPEDFLNFVFFREDTYGRNLVHRTEHCEVLILTWLPGQKTPIHDHGGQRCWVSIHMGELTFKTYAPITDEAKLPPVIEAAHAQGAGSPVYLDDGIGVHSIANASKKPAVSMHLYTGPITRCRIYDERLKRFVWKELSYHTQYGREARTHVLELD